MKLLLDRDADIESKCNLGRTPLLSWAVRYDRVAVVKLLLESSTGMLTSSLNAILAEHRSHGLFTMATGQ